MSDEAGAVVDRSAFDAWGKRRVVLGWTAPAPRDAGTLAVTRGFTGHEMLDDLGLVHMNGRIYDPGVGRFLSADPEIQAPSLAQNYDRYAYVLNNPLSLTDPSGFNFLDDFTGGFGTAKALGDWLGPTGRGIVSGVVGGVVTYFAGPIIGGFAQGFVMGQLSGVSTMDSLVMGLKGAAIGAATSGLGLLSNSVGGVAGYAIYVRGSAVVGGAASELQGGSFGEGAAAGAASAAISAALPIRGHSFEAYAGRAAIAAVVGGTAAEIGGGKFANGALSAAFISMASGGFEWGAEQAAGHGQSVLIADIWTAKNDAEIEQAVKDGPGGYKIDNLPKDFAETSKPLVREAAFLGSGPLLRWAGELFQGLRGLVGIGRLAKATRVAESIAEPTTTLYHGGVLRGGMVEAARISTTSEIEHAARYAAQKGGGQIYRFEVPTRRLRELMDSGLVRDFRDTLKGTRGDAMEYRFHPSVASELNQYRIGP